MDLIRLKVPMPKPEIKLFFFKFSFSRNLSCFILKILFILSKENVSKPY